MEAKFENFNASAYIETRSYYLYVVSPYGATRPIF